jgi:hypothetical protein
VATQPGGFAWAERTLQDTGRRVVSSLVDAHGKPAGDGGVIMELKLSPVLRMAVQMGVLGAFGAIVRPKFERFKHRWWVWR